MHKCFLNNKQLGQDLRLAHSINLYENYLRNIIWKIKFILLTELIILALK